MPIAHLTFPLETGIPSCLPSAAPVACTVSTSCGTPSMECTTHTKGTNALLANPTTSAVAPWDSGFSTYLEEGDELTVPYGAAAFAYPIPTDGSTIFISSEAVDGTSSTVFVSSFNNDPSDSSGLLSATSTVTSTTSKPTTAISRTSANPTIPRTSTPGDYTTTPAAASNPSMIGLPIASSSAVEFRGSGPNSAAIIGGAVSGGVALLLVAGVVALRRRWRRRKRRPTRVNDTSIVNNIAPYPILTLETRSRKVDGAERRMVTSTTEGATEGSSSMVQTGTPVPDITAVSAMFRQLERFLHSLHADRDEQRPGESAPGADRASDSLPQYSQVADL
ncbi:hypothetical protein PENSPDRAFT_748559 [Peniophora sp. CONT]|nr:hypothetical protein PENSPDRAFT_748559 [Peniophora sp. CONT]